MRYTTLVILVILLGFGYISNIYAHGGKLAADG